jgi:DNA-binding NarL/FixJ family response regulator
MAQLRQTKKTINHKHMTRDRMINKRLAVAMADSHLLFRREMKKIIEEMPNTTVVGEVADGAGLFRLLESRAVDLLILDISLPETRAMDATARITEKYPDVRVLLMVMDEDKEYQDRALAVGAYGVLLKQDAGTECSRAIEQVRRGKFYFPRHSEDDQPVTRTSLRGSDLLNILSICF